MLKLTYDSFSFAIVPDKLTSLYVEHNIWFFHLNNLVNKNKKKKERVMTNDKKREYLNLKIAYQPFFLFQHFSLFVLFIASTPIDRMFVSAQGGRRNEY